MTSSSLSTRRFFFFLFLSPAGRPIITLRRVETTGVVVVAGFFGLGLKGPETQLGPLYRVDFSPSCPNCIDVLFYFFFSLSISFIILFSLLLKLKRVQLTTSRSSDSLVSPAVVSFGRDTVMTCTTVREFFR
jgi:hypothetical protein